MLLPVIQHSVTAEGLHELGREGVIRIRRWLDSTARFDISHTAYDLDQAGHPFTQVRLEQLDGRFEHFDLVGDIRDETGHKGNTVYVECKNYSHAGNQAALYDDYLATCYSAFAARQTAVGHVPSIEFMWATTHPFAVTNFAKLTDSETVAAACKAAPYNKRLGSETYDAGLGELLAERLWLVVVNDRMLNEMIMGDALRAAVLGKMIELGAA
ncbi:MAG: hypothetical protein ACRDJX_03075 [Solirubrobacteraceae bacterium]